MTLSISSSEPGSGPIAAPLGGGATGLRSKRRAAIALALSLVVGLLAVAAVEWVARARSFKTAPAASTRVDELIEALPKTHIKGREIGHQMIAHNVALFSTHPDPASVKEAFVGTSRSKILRPQALGLEGAVNGSGNSYNEITYGLLLQAEAMRRQFPNLQRVWFEASLLMRRPDRVIIEADHEKYLPLLMEVAPLRKGLPNAEAFLASLEKRATEPPAHGKRLAILSQRGDWRLSHVFASKPAGEDGSIPVLQDPILNGLAPNGERRAMAGPGPKPGERPAPISQEHIKVQRLRDIPAWAPWDGLFDMIPRWGRQHGIEVVLYQPPVRGDLHRFQLDMGLSLHTADLQRISREYGVPFIDLNRPELGWMDDESVFSDEDHMETCKGVILLQFALEEGARLASQGMKMPVLRRESVEKLARGRLAVCGGGA